MKFEIPKIYPNPSLNPNPTWLLCATRATESITINCCCFYIKLIINIVLSTYVHKEI